MAKILTWRDEWTLRIDTLDEDHREIVGLLSEIARRFGEDSEQCELPRAGSTSDGGYAEEDLYASLDRFGALARRHFQREEEFIRTIDYPGLVDHCSEHLMLMAEFTDFVRDLRVRRVVHLDHQDLQALKQWVAAHVLGADRKFADHYFQICS